jgi:Fic-DOC domain mobile mystery protein B
VRFDDPPGATPIDPEEASALIPSLSTQEELNEFEELNILEAVRWSRSSLKLERELLTFGGLQLLHKRMFDRTLKWAGQFRLTQKSIGVEAYRIVPELHGLTEDCKVWLTVGSYPPDEIAARFHHRLVWIHPFPNGNGRHARLATDLLTRYKHWRPFTWGSGNIARESGTRRAYIDSLRRADSGDIEPLMEFMRSG